MSGYAQMIRALYLSVFRAHHSAPGLETEIRLTRLTYHYLSIMLVVTKFSFPALLANALHLTQAISPLDLPVTHVAKPCLVHILDVDFCDHAELSM